MQVVLLNPPRGARRRKLALRRRRRTRNTKWAPEFAESPASLNPGRRRRRSGRNYGRRRFSRRRRGRNTKWAPEFAESPASLNPRRRGGRGRARRRNPYWVPRYAMNPAGALRAVVSGFSSKVLMEAVPLAAGGLGNNLLTGIAARTLPLPEFLKNAPGNVVLSAAGAGLLGFAVGLADRGIGSKIFLGGLVDTLKKGVDWLLGRVGIVSGLSCGPGCMADYLSVGDAARARSLGYLTVSDANALSPVGVPGGLSTDSTVEQELAG